jgi:hypothetical protein
LRALIDLAFANLAISCLNSTLESTGRYWRMKYGYPENMYGPFNGEPAKPSVHYWAWI